MAKRGRQAGTLSQAAGNVGAALGHIAGRVDALKRERAAITKHLHELLASAHSVLGDLGHSASATGEDLRTVVGIIRKGGRPKGYKMSAATKAKLRAAWARRKAAAGVEVKKDVKAVKKAVRKMSAEARARISAAQKARWAKAKKA